MKEAVVSLGATALGRVVLALVLFIVGSIFIRYVMKAAEKSQLLSHADGMLRTFLRSFVRIGLYCLLVIVVIGTLGVESASIAAAVASMGVTIGLGLQGALSNLAGGIMLLIFRPFKLGDYIEAAGTAGTVSELTLFYTVLLTPDNKKVTVPNGGLMNANVVDFSAQPTRRVEAVALVSRSERVSRVQELLLEAAGSCPLVLTEPEGPFARITGSTNEALQYSVRVWCKSADYWTVYHDLHQRVQEALLDNGIAGPSVKLDR